MASCKRPADPERRFPFGGWAHPYWDDVLDQTMAKVMGVPFDLVLGRRTYDVFAAFWPNAPEEAGGKPLNDATKYVASRGTPSLTWDRSVQIEGDVAEGVARLKQEDG